MITFILPGFSKSNKNWVDDTADFLEKSGLKGQIRPIYWDHWQDEEKTLNPKEKARILADISAKEKEINVIAKSVGTLVAAHVTEKIPEKISKVILCGIPSVSDERLRIFSKSYSKIDPSKIIVFQNIKDPFAGFEEVNKFILKVNPKIAVCRMKRSDHTYPFFEEFTKHLQKE